MIRILVIDADDTSRETLRGWGEAFRPPALAAADEEEALGLVSAEGEPGVVVIDVDLPGEGGPRLAGHFRRVHPQAAVVMTGPADLERAVRAVQGGAVDYVVEPLSALGVADALERAWTVHVTRRRLARARHLLDRRVLDLTVITAQLEESVWTSLEALCAAREQDPAAAARRRRVAALSVNLALVLGLREPGVTDVERAAMLRGPAYAPGSDEQRVLQLLAAVPILGGALEIAAAVRERYDGSGQPHGWRGAAIPVGARIIAVAAAYDELLWGVSRPPVLPLEALGLLAPERARRFDPAVLDALGTLRPVYPVSAQAAAAAIASVPDPRRRWTRKHLASAVPARVGETRGRLLDVAYGGFRFESASRLQTQASPFRLRLPELGVYASARWVWIAPAGTPGLYLCGAVIADEDARAGSPWHALVDALPAALQSN